MTRILTEGFEDGTGAAFNLSSGAIVSSEGRSGTYSGSEGTFSNVFSSSYSELYIRVAVKFIEFRTLNVRWYNNTTILGTMTITSNAINSINLYVGSSLVGSYAPSLSNGAYYLIELHVLLDNTSGMLEVRLEGVPILSFSGDTIPDALTTINRLDFNMNNNTFIDDIAVNDTTGATDNSWCGDGRVIGLLPNANGDSSQLVGNDGNSTDNYLLVDDRPSDSDTTYVYSDTIDEFDLYNLAPCGLTDVNIMRVWTQATAKQTVTESGKLSLGIKSGTTEDWDTEDLLTATYTQYKSKEYLTDPDTDAAWTVAGVDALQAGIKVK